MRSASIGLGLAVVFVASGAAGEYVVGVPAEALRTDLKLAPFYEKCIVSEGFAVLGSKRVSDYALREAAFIIDRMLDGRADLRTALVRNKIRLAVMASSELTIDVPEHSDLTPPQYWNKRARGLGATAVRPAVSCGEENLLEFPGDPYAGENILTHEFGHAIHEIALRDVDREFDGRLRTAYQEAMREELWKGTYATTNHKEYWAEGVQSWFDANQDGVKGHNTIATRERIKKYDPRLSALLAEVFRGNEWRYVRPSQRKDAAHLAGFDPTRSPRFAWSKELLEWYERKGRALEKKQ
jgi:hypothetical protein